MPCRPETPVTADETAASRAAAAAAADGPYALRACNRSYWHEQTVWPVTGSVTKGRPESQQGEVAPLATLPATLPLPPALATLAEPLDPALIPLPPPGLGAPTEPADGPAPLLGAPLDIRSCEAEV